MTADTIRSLSPIYDVQRSYLDNAEEGPFFDGSIPNRPRRDSSCTFLGFRLASPIGVPAGPLLNARWIDLAGKLGFDVLCYKTIRSREHTGHPVPNVIYVENNLDNPAITALSLPPDSIDDLAITNSFGMPSRSPTYLQKDIPLANLSLAPDQLMIVSVVGSASADDFLQDFVNTALFAKECGAKVIEANFSCPNVAGKEGDIADNADSLFALAKALVDALKETPLVIKMGALDEQRLKNSLNAAARAGVRAVSGINTVSKQVVTKEGRPALGKERPTSGICGNPIRPRALSFIRSARDIITEDKLDLALIGCGGITRSEHFQDFLNAGADIAMTATGMMWDPYIAMRYHEQN